MIQLGLETASLKVKGWAGAVICEDCLFSFGNKQDIAVELLLLAIQDFESFDCFLKGARISLGFFGCLADNLV